MLLFLRHGVYTGSNHFTTYFPQNVPVKKIRNRSIFGEDMDKSLWLTCLGHPVYLRLRMWLGANLMGMKSLCDCMETNEHHGHRSLASPALLSYLCIRVLSVRPRRLRPRCECVWHHRSPVNPFSAKVTRFYGKAQRGYVCAISDMVKYADDTYLIVPLVNSVSSEDELKHLWAVNNNLRLSQAKTIEIVFFTRGRHRAEHKTIIISARNSTP